MKLFTLIVATSLTSSWAFIPSSLPRAPVTIRKAGGFEWEDPTENLDQGVENPFKNPGLMTSEDGMKIEAARLLGPRLNGANLYFVGMMGSGKTAVGDIVARSKCLMIIDVARLFHFRSFKSCYRSPPQEWGRTTFWILIKLLRGQLEPLFQKYLSLKERMDSGTSSRKFWIRFIPTCGVL